MGEQAKYYVTYVSRGKLNSLGPVDTRSEALELFQKSHDDGVYNVNLHHVYLVRAVEPITELTSTTLDELRNA